MFAALKISKFGWIVTFSLFLTMFMVTTTSTLSIYKTQDIEESWAHLEQQSIRKSHLLSQVRRLLGYDGVIHHFKDFIIRRKRTDAMKVHQKLFELSIALSAYNETTLLEDEQRAFSSLINLVDLYKKNITLAETMTDNGLSQSQIDSFLKFDNSVVNEQLKILDRFHLQQFKIDSDGVAKSIKDLTLLSEALRAILILLLLPLAIFIIWYIHKRLIVPFSRFSNAFNTTHTDRFACTQLPIDAHLRHTELGQFASAFNLMTENLEKNATELKFQKRALDEHAIVSIADIKGDIIYANDKFCEISKYSRDELIGKNHRILQSNEHSEAFFSDMWKTIHAGKPWHGEIRNINKLGELYWVQTTIVPTLDDSDKPFQYVAIRTEITARKKAEADLLESYIGLERQISVRTEELQKALQAEKEASVMQKQFVSMASHEFRTPLSIIDMTAQRLMKRHSTMTEQQIIERFKKIRNASKRITGLIESTLNSARLEDGKISYTHEQCDVRNQIRECVETQMDVAQGYVIDTDIIALPAIILADSGHLTQIFTNLLSNAVKYSPDHKHIEVRGWTEDDHAFVSFTDQGIGIPKQEQEKVFNRFFRTSSAAGIPGTGIGLNLIKQLIELQGGNINFKSTDGKGTTFTVTLLIKPLN